MTHDSKPFMKPPNAMRIPSSQIHHGHILNDEYAWMRDDNWQNVIRVPSKLNAVIRNHLEAENAYTNTVMADTEQLQKNLFDEMKGRIEKDAKSVPINDGPWSYFIRYRTGDQYPLFCRQKRNQKGTATVLLDNNILSKNKSYFSIRSIRQSPDHKLIAYGVDDKGSELYTLYIRDLLNNADLTDTITDTSGSSTWSADSHHLFYVRLDDNHRPCRAYRHKIGTTQDEDTLVYEENDSAFFVSISKTQDNNYIKIIVHGHDTTETHLLDANTLTDEPRLILARETGHEYYVEHNNDMLYLLSNKDAADFRIITVSLDDPRYQNWKEIIPHKTGQLILSIQMLAEHLIRQEQYDGLIRIVIRRLCDGTEHTIAFKEEIYSLGLQDGCEFHTTSIRFIHSSMTTPSRVFDYDVETREKIERKVQKVPSGHDPRSYIAKRLYAIGHDGQTVPINLLYHTDTPLDGSAPLYLYGYGAYGMSMDANFSITNLSLVDRGFIYAIAHVRGGKDKGYNWYSDGKLLCKKNSFLDFLAVARHLIAEGYTQQGNIVAEGRSAGGLLVGAVANMAPELFLAIIAGVPFVDTLNTMLDDSLPLTPPEWNEWGNPITNPKDFDNIRSYSPYDNVTSKAYPHILATGGLTDPRVTYWEPAKWIARLRNLRTNNDRMMILHTQMEAGHGGKSGRFEALRDIAFSQAFTLKAAGRHNTQNINENKS